MTETRVFQYPETVPVHAEVKDWEGNFVNPTSIKVTVTNPAGTVVVDNLDMASEGVGKFVYYYRPAVGAVLGWYTAKALVVDGVGASAITTVVLAGFILE